jgi:filamentous hemagglutinin
VLDAAKNGAGEEVIQNLGDDAFKGMTKMSYSETSANGVLSEVHYVKDPRTGALMDFKFKPSTIQKTNSVTRYANATKHGTIVAPK